MSENEAKVEEEEVEAPKKSLLPTFIISGFVAAVVIVETAIFFFMVPSASDVAALAEARLIEKVEANMEADGEETLDNDEEIKEFSMGDYDFGFTPPGAARKHLVQFELFGLVRSQDMEEIEELFKEHQGRFRDRMLEEVRNASMDELNQLGLLKRRIFATSNDILGGKTPLLQGIGFKRYVVMEE